MATEVKTKNYPGTSLLMHGQPNGGVEWMITNKTQGNGDWRRWSSIISSLWTRSTALSKRVEDKENLEKSSQLEM